MKKFLSIIFIFSFLFLTTPFLKTTCSATSNETPMMAIVIDDFGSYDQSGVDKILSLKVPITCACIPNVDNTQDNIKKILANNHELILHMPMEAHVYLPENWYGPTYIKNYDSDEVAINKLKKCLSSFPNVKGFNIHIGSGVGKSERLMSAIYNFANQNGLYFLDSRTIITDATENACKKTNSTYLGRDVFLEADKNRSYGGVMFRLNECASLAKQKGYSICIGHVGAEGGENTANALADFVNKIEQTGVKIVPLSTIYEKLNTKNK